MADRPQQSTAAAPRLGEHAIVIGASMAGLFAARVLSDHYRHVTVLERDELPASGRPRRAVPQDRHAHALQPAGQEALKRLFPDFVADAVSAGALPFRAGPDMRVTASGHRLPKLDSRAQYVVAPRPLLEGVVRERVAALANVTIRERCGVVGLVERHGRVTGVRARDVIRHSTERTLRADLVVAASGRGGRVPGWLRAMGYEPPAEERVAVDIVYASRRVRLRPGALPGDMVIVDDARADRPRGMFMIKEDADERWTITLEGYGTADRPPTDDAGFAAFLASVADPDVLAAVEHAEPLGDAYSHAFPASVRRRYERLSRFPDGLLVMGDALCSFNPIYGQGMAVAALEALVLQRCLREGDRRLAQRFFKAASVPVDHAWKLAIGSDLSKPYVAGRAALPGRLVGRYMERLLAVAAHDVEVARAFALVVSLLKPPSTLLSPAIARRVLRRGAARPRPAAARPAVLTGAEAPANA
jgi:2-polyprenyl-6-methoxyphenol hydroxylase-like FAD-dependent oxidoreductase